jgi:tetratricopeptide (TPR) repeat protein
MRGDEAFARDSLEQALAEYRLAVRQGGDNADVLARVAHTYVALGRVPDASLYYDSAASADDKWADMGAADLVRLARAASERGDLFQMSAAMEAARSLKPGIAVADLTLPLARHYFQIGEYGRALPLYQRALTERGNPGAVLSEVGRRYFEIGDCKNALTYLERYREVAEPEDLPDVNLSIGGCGLRLAKELRRPDADNEILQDALRYVNRTLELGEPRNQQADAWFEKGEILNELGDCDAALQAYDQVRSTGSRTTQLVERARQRIEAVRASRGLVEIRGRCG